MEILEVSVPADEQPLLADLACPICGGLLVPLREHMRCSRCYHSFCDTCDGTANREE